MSETSLTKEFVAQRDLNIYQMRATGMSHTDIAKRLNLTTRAVAAAIQRQTRKLNREANYAYPEVLRLELDRLDKLQTAMWPLCFPRNITMSDGSQITIEPDIKAAETVLKVMAARQKLLGMDVQRHVVDITQDIKHTLHGHISDEESKVIDYRSETKDLIELMIEARILDRPQAEAIMEAAMNDDTEITVFDIEEKPQLVLDKPQSDPVE